MIAAELGGIPCRRHGPRFAGFFMVKARHLDERAQERARFVRCIEPGLLPEQCLLWVPREHWPRSHVVHCGVERRGLRAPGPRGHRVSTFSSSGAPASPRVCRTCSRLSPGCRAELPDTGSRSSAAGRAAGAEARRPCGRQYAVACCSPGTRVLGAGRRVALEGGTCRAAQPGRGRPMSPRRRQWRPGCTWVATNVGGTSELVVDGENGFLVPPTVTDALGVPDPPASGRPGAAVATRALRAGNGASRLRSGADERRACVTSSQSAIAGGGASETGWRRGGAPCGRLGFQGGLIAAHTGLLGDPTAPRRTQAYRP